MYYKSFWSYILLLLCLSQAEARADVHDSIIVPSDAQQDMYDRVVASPLGLSLLPRTSFAFSSLAYGRESGRLMRVQMPERAQNISLKSVGLHSSDRWQLYGEFAYSRHFEDSVQWLLSETPTDGLPYYFASPRKGGWEIERYDIKGAFNAHIAQKLVVGAAISVRHSRGARSNDPRPSTESFVSDYEVFGGFSGTRFSALLSGGLGRGTRDNDLIYNNPDNDRILRLDMMAYELMGFGMNRKTQQFQNRSLQTDVRSYRLGAQMQWQTDSLQWWLRAGYEHRCDSIRRSRTVNVERSTLTAYTIKKTSVDAGLSLPLSQNIKLQVQAFAAFTEGRDYLINVLQGFNNYVYDSRRFGFSALATHRLTPSVVSQYGLSAEYDYEKRQEGASEHSYDRKGYTFRASWDAQKAYHAYYLFCGLAQRVQLSTASLTYPASQENIFTTDIAKPLYNYYNTPQATSSLRCGVGKAFGQYHVSLALRYALAYALNGHHGIKGTRQYFSAALYLSF